MSLTKIDFESKVIKFTNDFMYKYNINMLRKKNQPINVSLSNKLKFYDAISLCHMFNISACGPFWKMARKRVNIFSMKKED